MELICSTTTRASDPYAGATIRSLRLKPVTSVLSATSCAEAIETMRDRGFDQLPVLAGPGGKLVGLVTLGNLLSYISRGRATGQSPVSDVSKYLPTFLTRSPTVLFLSPPPSTPNTGTDS